ncbi:hypothetical protein F5Y09DRAFT_337297 [Xylaria sp. FL1042]|nr:hypothetical protein F5Y09DRAFT_337297 [Xylaria sp. FL1042]
MAPTDTSLEVYEAAYTKMTTIFSSGHELEQFSKEEWEMMKVPIGMAEMYTQPMWTKHNEGLSRLTDPDRSKGPLIAPKCGHFIQKDNPPFVAEQLGDLIKKVETSN